MVNPFHKIENAKTALEMLDTHSDVEVVEKEEELGSARVAFEFKDGTSVRTLKGVTHHLESTGYEETTEESNICGVMEYEWDKKCLTE